MRGMTDKEWYSTKEVAKILSFSEETIRRLIREGIIEARPFGSRYRVHRSQLERVSDEKKPSQ